MPPAASPVKVLAEGSQGDGGLGGGGVNVSLSIFLRDLYLR